MEDRSRPMTGLSGRSVSSSQRSRISAGHYSQRSRASEVDALRVPPRMRHNYDPPFQQAGCFAVTGVPGYTGYVPGKLAENVHALTFQKANERARAEVDWMATRGKLPMPYRGRTYDGPLPGTEVPGYMGFVPGRHADNVIGQSAQRGAETAFILKTQQASERQNRVAHYREGNRPPTGTYDHAGYHSQKAANCIDTRMID
eukprot:TRINITY_DN98503_c0_g1_i1.p1 TRINITY_DN98503_c0_g1~~TRINITY_DN98503_c0_g1_i1.p1  ORF type:complete len:201 (+),score=27.59 TRINITY_DN98503_c0_g1_i1:65-667(+)